MHLQMDVLNDSLGARDLKTTAYTPLKQASLIPARLS